jgi:hypothetical protein
MYEIKLIDPKVSVVLLSITSDGMARPWRDPIFLRYTLSPAREDGRGRPHVEAARRGSTYRKEHKARTRRHTPSAPPQLVDIDHPQTVESTISPPHTDIHNHFHTSSPLPHTRFHIAQHYGCAGGTPMCLLRSLAQIPNDPISTMKASYPSPTEYFKHKGCAHAWASALQINLLMTGWLDGCQECGCAHLYV